MTAKTLILFTAALALALAGTAHAASGLAGINVDMNKIAPWATAAVALLAVITTLIAVWWQLRRQRLLSSAAMVISMLDKFTSKEWRADRAKCAQLLGRHQSGEDNIDLVNNFPVIVFFETIGYLVRKGAVEKKIVWNTFGWHVARYYMCLTRTPNLIEKQRRDEDDITAWENFEWLAKKMLHLYRKRGVQLDHPGTLMDFISRESSAPLRQEHQLSEPPQAARVIQHRWPSLTEAGLGMAAFAITLQLFKYLLRPRR